MRIKVLAYAICIFFIILLQSTVLEYIKIFGVKPSLPIIFIVSVALLRGNVEGAVVGFFTGLSQDIVSGKILGLYALLGLYLGLAIGSVNKRLYRENFLVVIFFTFVSSVIYECMVFFLYTILPLLLFHEKDQLDLLVPLGHIILPEAIYNSVVSVFVYMFVIKLNHKFEEISKASRKY